MSNKEFLDYEGLGYLAEHVNLQDGKKIVKKLRTGETTLTITDSVITTDSIIDIYSDLYGAYATSVTQSNGSLSITFPVQDRDLNIIVIVRDGRGGGINPTGNAVEGDVLLNKTFSNDDGVDKVGTMPNNGAVSPSALSPNGSYTIPEGYHNGNGVVSASPNTGTYSPTTRNAALDMGIDNLYRYVDTTGVPNANTQTYTPASNNSSLDMGATNNYRYVNTNTVYNLGKNDSSARTLWVAFKAFAQFGANDPMNWTCSFTPDEETGLLIVFAGASDTAAQSSNASCTVTIGGVNQNFDIAQTADSGGYGRHGLSSYIVSGRKSVLVEYKYNTPQLHTASFTVLWIHP